MKAAAENLESNFDWFDKSPMGEKLYFESTTIRAMEEYATLRVKEAIDNQEKWVSADNPPKLIEGENYSPNVFAICNGEMRIMCYCYIPGDDGGFVWADCGNKIDGDAEFDDEYDVTHWMPLPKNPITNKH